MVKITKKYTQSTLGRHLRLGCSKLRKIAIFDPFSQEPRVLKRFWKGNLSQISWKPIFRNFNKFLKTFWSEKSSKNVENFQIFWKSDDLRRQFSEIFRNWWKIHQNHKILINWSRKTRSKIDRFWKSSSFNEFSIQKIAFSEKLQTYRRSSTKGPKSQRSVPLTSLRCPRKGIMVLKSLKPIPCDVFKCRIAKCARPPHFWKRKLSPPVP